MNDNQFFNYLHTIEGIDQPDYIKYWAPEQPLMALDNPYRDTEANYQKLVVEHFREKYGNLKYLTAAQTLAENAESFKNRIDGNIKDGWLSAKVFGPIAENCVFILSILPNKEPYQNQLLQIFRNIVDESLIRTTN